MMKQGIRLGTFASMIAAFAAAPSIQPPTGRRGDRYYKLQRIKLTEARQRSGSQYARDHRGEPGRNGGPKGV